MIVIKITFLGST